MTEEATEQRIKKVLAEKEIVFEELEHEPVFTNPTMAEALGVKTAETVKNLLLETREGSYIQVLLPGDQKLDSKKLATKVGTKKLSFAKPEKVLEIAGCEVGCVPPFGHRQIIKVYMDKKLLWNDHVYFNPGVHHKSVKISSQDLKALCNASMI